LESADPLTCDGVVPQATPYLAGGKVVNFAEPCDYFREGKAKASTLSLSVLVAIEMFNALNALSEVRSKPPPYPLPCFTVHAPQQEVRAIKHRLRQPSSQRLCAICVQSCMEIT